MGNDKCAELPSTKPDVFAKNMTKQMLRPARKNSPFSKNSHFLLFYNKQTVICAVQTVRSFEKHTERLQAEACVTLLGPARKNNHFCKNKHFLIFYNENTVICIVQTVRSLQKQSERLQAEACVTVLGPVRKKSHFVKTIISMYFTMKNSHVCSSDSQEP